MTSAKQLMALRADARSDDIYAVCESLFGYHVCRACTWNVPSTSEPVKGQSLVSLVIGCRLGYSGLGGRTELIAKRESKDHTLAR